MNTPGLSVLIPAAGASKRLGRAKQLVLYKGKTLVQRAVDSATSLGASEIIVVTGCSETRVRQVLENSKARCISNPQWTLGMGSSIATGVNAVDPRSVGLMILLCDQWRIGATDLQILAVKWQCDIQRIVAAQANGRCCPPVIFPSSCFAVLAGLDGDQGAQNVLLEHPNLLVPVPMVNAAFDLDSPAQLEQLENS